MLKSGRSTALLAGLMLSAAAFGIACGGSNNNKNTGNNAATQAAATQAATAVATSAGSPTSGGSVATAVASAKAVTAAATAAGAPSGKQEYRTNLGGEPDSIDPSKASFQGETTVVEQLFRQLFNFDKDLNLIPDIATVVPTKDNGGISADGTKYTFKLKPGQLWSDGQPVTSKNFAYSLRRAVKPGIGGDYSDFFTAIKGAAAANKLKPDDPGLQAALDAIAITTPDDSTLTVELEKPNSVFLQFMALWTASPLREDIITKFGDDKWTEAGNLIGNGPFLLKEWQHKDHITFVKNDKYTGADKPKLDTMIMRMIPDTNQAYNSYIAGDLDAVSVPSALTKTVDADPNLKKENLRYPRATVFWLGFNNGKAPFDNKKVRQAFSFAIDRDALVNGVYQGVNLPAYSAIPPGMPGYDAEAGKQYKLDPAKAKQTLTDAGFANGQNLPKITLTYSEGGTNQPQAEFLKEQFSKNLGINIELESVDSKTFQARTKSNDYQLIFIGWGLDYPDPESAMVPNFKTGAGNNKPRYSNPAFDALLDQAQAETDAKKRVDLYQQSQKLMIDDAPVAFLFVAQGNVLRKPYLKGVIDAPIDAVAARFRPFVFIQR